MLFREKKLTDEIKLAVADRIGFVPSAGQQQFISSTKRCRVLAAGSRFGKSMVAGFETLTTFLIPNTRTWIVGPQYELAEKEFDWFVHFLSRLETNGICLMDVCRTSLSARGSKHVTAPWGSVVRTKTCEKPQLLLGDEIDLAVMCEASQFVRVIYERYLRMRLGPRNGALIATSTPNGDGDLFQDFFEAPQKESDWESWNFPTSANPHFSREELERLKAEMAEEVFREQVLGEFVSRRGTVFTLSPENVREFEINKEFVVAVGCEYKPHNPIAVTFMAISPDRVIYVYDEIFYEGNTPRDIAPVIAQRVAGRSVMGIFVDYWDVAIQRDFGESMDFCIGTIKKEKSIGKNAGKTKRIQAVQNFLKVREDGFTRLVVHSKCENTINHFANCKWPDKRREGADQLERSFPLDKYLSLPMSIAYVAGFMESLS